MVRVHGTWYMVRVHGTCQGARYRVQGTLRIFSGSEESLQQEKGSF